MEPLPEQRRLKVRGVCSDCNSRVLVKLCYKRPGEERGRTPGSLIVFHPFRLDPVNEQLWRGTELVPVRPKPFALLRYLAEHPGRLITKEELNKALWPDSYVGESSLKGYIRDLREVLGDEPEGNAS